MSRLLESPNYNYFDWRLIYPELQILLDNIETITTESAHLPQWIPWPEDHYAENSNPDNWTVFPLMHTFPAYDPSKTSWVEATCRHAPQTVEILKTIPRLKTALFSRLLPGTKVLICID